MPGPHDGRRAQTIRIYIRHHNDPEGRFQPREKTCGDYEDPRTHVVHKGCGATLFRFVTFPNGKGMLFDSAPRVVEGSEASIGDGGIVASVTTENVHFSTCPMRQRGGVDGKAAASGATRV